MVRHFPAESAHAHCIARAFSRFAHAWHRGFYTLVQPSRANGPIFVYICDSHCSFYLSPRINCCTSYGPPGAARTLRANVKPAHLKVKGSFIQLMSSACSTVTGEPQRQRLASRTTEERETRFSRRWAPHRPRRAADSLPAIEDDK